MTVAPSHLRHPLFFKSCRDSRKPCGTRRITTLSHCRSIAPLIGWCDACDTRMCPSQSVAMRHLRHLRQWISAESAKKSVCAFMGFLQRKKLLFSVAIGLSSGLPPLGRN